LCCVRAASLKEFDTKADSIDKSEAFEIQIEADSNGINEHHPHNDDITDHPHSDGPRSYAYTVGSAKLVTPQICFSDPQEQCGNHYFSFQN